MPKEVVEWDVGGIVTMFVDPKTLDGGPYPTDKCIIAITERFHELGPDGEKPSGWDLDFIRDEMKKLEKDQTEP